MPLRGCHQFRAIQKRSVFAKAANDFAAERLWRAGSANVPRVAASGRTVKIEMTGERGAGKDQCVFIAIRQDVADGDPLTGIQGRAG
jgi:hypothetical protein